MNLSLFSDWMEQQLFGDGDLAHLMADIIDEAMAHDGPGAGAPTQADRSLFESAWQAAQAEPEAVRWRVAIVLGRLGFEQAAPTLESAIKCGDPSIARPAAIAVARLRSPDDELLALLSETMPDPAESREIRSAAARTIAKINTTETICHLARVAASEDTDLAQYGVEGLAYTRPVRGSEEHRRALEALLGALASNEPLLRLAAVEALGRFGDPEAIPPLEKMLIEKDPALRRRTLFALAKLGAESAKAPLTRMLGDISIPARWEIVDLLGESYGEQMLDALAGAAKDRDAEIRDHVVAALAGMTGRASLDLLERIAQNDEDGFVREQAQAALAERSRRPPEPVKPEAVTTSTIAASAPRSAAVAPTARVEHHPSPAPPAAAQAPPWPKRAPAKLQPLYEAPPQRPPEPKCAPANIIERALEAMDCRWRIDAEGYQVEVHHAHTKEKVAILLGEADYEESPIYRFVVNCGPAREAAYEAALRNNRFLDYGCVAVADASGEPAFVLTDTMPAEGATVAGVRKTVLALARAAAQLRG